MNPGSTQVLTDTTTYLYGLGRIAQFTSTVTSYFLPDALGSVRQLMNDSGEVTLAKRYQPFGDVMQSAGDGASSFGYTGEQQQGGLVYLRARYYASGVGRFVSSDPWAGDAQRPMSYNKWLYVYANVVNLTDPSGYDAWWCEGRSDSQQCYDNYYGRSSGNSVTNTPTPTPTLTQSPTGTPSPTLTPTSNATSTPTPTITPTLNPVGGATSVAVSQSLNAAGCGTPLPGGTPIPAEKVWWMPVNTQTLVALYISREAQPYLNKPDKLAYVIEAIARQYWNHCPNGCEVVNGVPDNALANFLAYSESYRKFITNYKDALGGGNVVNHIELKRTFSIGMSLVSQVLEPELNGHPEWRNGQEDDEIYGWFNVMSDNPQWMKDWAVRGVISDKKPYDLHAMVYSSQESGGTGSFIVLTPHQQRELCGNMNCTQVRSPIAPTWVHEFLYGGQ